MSKVYRIYKLTSHESDKCYVGQTTLDLKARLQRHETAFRAFMNNKKMRFTTANEIIGLGKYEIILIDTTDNKQHAHELEGYYVKMLKTVNKSKPHGKFVDGRKMSSQEQHKMYSSFRVPCSACHCNVLKQHMEKHKMTSKHRKNECFYIFSELPKDC